MSGPGGMAAVALSVGGRIGGMGVVGFYPTIVVAMAVVMVAIAVVMGVAVVVVAIAVVVGVAAVTIKTSLGTPPEVCP